MFIVYYRNDLNNGKIIRPTPFISISYSLDRTKEKAFGGTYNITLNGILLSNAGSPLANSNPQNILGEGPNYEDNPAGNYSRPQKQIIDFNDRAYSMFLKQQAIRALFAHDGQKMEFSSIRNDDPIIVFYPEVQSISFEEGTYVDFCRYTINLTAPILYDRDDKILDLAYNFYDGNVENKNYHIENYSDTWAIEVDESFARTPNNIPPNNPINNTIPRSYRVTRNVSATGKNIYLTLEDQTTKREEAWEQAKKFVKFNILKENINTSATNTLTQFPGYNTHSVFASGLLHIPTGFSAYNHVRSENIDKTAGTYSLSDTWILSSGSSIETYNLSLSSSNDSPLLRVNVDGTIKGLSDNTANNFANNNKYNNALEKFNTISNSGNFGVGSTLYKRANNSTSLVLNPIPASFSLTQNEQLGEINYTLSFDNRPNNFISGVLQENITITDTYPGDIYSIIPIINSNIGPIFQYIGGRTEYRRDLNIEFTVSRNGIGYNKMSNKSSYIYKKPSILSNDAANNRLSIADSIERVINNCSPANEPGIRKYFISPPSENWDPKTGRYSLQISWTYELDK